VSEERTKFITLPQAPASDDRQHVLVLVEGERPGQRWPLPAGGLAIGRAPPADIALADPAISRMHCRVVAENGQMLVIDAGSTNGSFIDGLRVDGQAPWPVGSLLRVGAHVFQHDLASHALMRRDDERQRDLQTALAYVKAQFPPQGHSNTVEIDWHYVPSTELGGDAFGATWLPDGRFCCHLIDVSGHGAGAAMHAVAVMNALRPQALGSVDPGNPAAVLARLNTLFPMEAHADMYFTIWYGVFDPSTRQLAFAAAGHHPAWCCLPGQAPVALGTRNRMIGTPIARPFAADVAVLPPAASLYLFSDGVFEIVDHAGRGWQIGDFVALLQPGPVAGLSHRLHAIMQRKVPGGRFGDDFALLALHFA
jgi:sigma-B regulation protein RsbU (phosphoserine phosphatase)